MDCLDLEEGILEGVGVVVSFLGTGIWGRERRWGNHGCIRVGVGGSIMRCLAKRLDVGMVASRGRWLVRMVVGSLMVSVR